MSSIVLVVIYNKLLNQSNTVKSIANSDYFGDVVIFNNGPNQLMYEDDYLFCHMKEKGCSIKIVEDLSNRPLSVIYNDFLNYSGYDYYFIFDDDTEFDSSFFEEKWQTNADISLPIIKSVTTKKIYYPIIDNKTYVMNQKLQNSQEIISIGSGLMINSSLIGKFRRNKLNLFDERFALYGVDYSVFRRINLLKNKNENINFDISGVLLHSLSRIDEEKYSKFRNKERAIDLLLTKMYYPRRFGFFNLLSILKTLFTQLIKKDFCVFYVLIKVLILKSHPRSYKYKYRWSGRFSNID